MEGTRRIAVLTIFFSFAIAWFLCKRRHPPSRPPLGPTAFPLLGNLVWFTSKATVIMVADRDLAHEMLVQHGAIFADRPAASLIRLLAPNYNIIAKCGYGPRWCLLRRNLAMEMLSPSRVKNMAEAREWALQILFHELRSEAKSKNGSMIIRDAFRQAIFCLQLFLFNDISIHKFDKNTDSISR